MKIKLCSLNTTTYPQRAFLYHFLGILLLFGNLSCETPSHVSPKEGPPELDQPDEVIPWQRSGKISASSLSLENHETSHGSNHQIDFKKVAESYPFSNDLKVILLSVEFEGAQPEIWNNWNQQIFHTVEKMKLELRKKPELEKQLRNLQRYKKQNLSNDDGVREVQFNRIEITPQDRGYDLIFTSEIPGLFEYKLELK